MKIKKESPQVQRARKKLEKEFAEEDKKITPLALKQMRVSIENWINRHAADRISLAKKNISLFDGNQHPENVHNKHVQHLLAQLREGSKKNPPSIKRRVRR